MSYGEDDDGSVEDLAGRIRNDSASDLGDDEDASMSDEGSLSDDSDKKKPASKPKSAASTATASSKPSKDDEAKLKADQEARKKAKRIE
jgi:hypothetical protein